MNCVKRHTNIHVNQHQSLQYRDKESGDTRNQIDINNCTKINNKRGLRIAHHNIRSLLPNLDEVKVTVQEHSFDVLALNETRLGDTIHDARIDIDDYAVYRKDRNTRGGGVLIYVNENRLNHKLRRDLMMDQVELVTIEINQPKSSPIVVIAWYRPPGSSTVLFDAIETILMKLDDENKDIIFLGDFNCDYLAAVTNNCYTNRLRQICDDFSLVQVIDRATRITSNSSTMIDLIYTNNENKIIESGVMHIGTSDHSLVFIVWGKSRYSVSKHVYRTYRS